MSANRHAFTLIELLVVISIIALLIGILLPALGAARQTANAMTCLSKLRQMGIGVMIYVDEHDRHLPPGIVPQTGGSGYVTDWTVLLPNIMGSKGKRYSEVTETGSSGLRELFTDADTLDVRRDPDDIVNHYTCHPRLMPDLSSVEAVPEIELQLANHGRMWYVNLDTIRKSSDLILIMDGAQVEQINGDATSTCFRLDKVGPFGPPYLLSRYAKEGTDDQMIDAGPNTDAGFGQTTNTSLAAGNIRWRHHGDTTANFLFLDGHAESRQYLGPDESGIPRGDVLRREVYID